MSALHTKGLDAEGFILTLPAVPVQPEFQAVLDDVCTSLAQPEFRKPPSANVGAVEH